MSDSKAGTKLDKSLTEDVHLVESHTTDDILYDTKDFNQAYLDKSKVISKTIDYLGFGRYQIGLFFVAGFGWFNDNAFPVITSLILARLDEVDGVHLPPKRAPFLTLAQNLGLLAGAAIWSTVSDVFGRRWAFNITFLVTGIFAVVAGASPNFAAIGTFDAFWSFGVGGNLPVDSAIFLEALPTSHKWLLTAMAAWWSLGQLVANLVSWPLLGNYSCDDALTVCYKADNKGWRYFLYTMGGLTLILFIARFSFRVFESPQFYVARGDDERALATLHKIARINGKELLLTIDDFSKYDDLEVEKQEKKTFNNELLKQKLSKYKFDRIRECFHTKRLALCSTLVITVWGLIGLAFPLYNAFLPYYLETRGDANKPLSVHDTYRNSLIVAVVGVPGAILAGFLVELRIGRKGTLAGSLVVTGVILLGSTTAKTSNQVLIWNSFFSFVSNIMYAVLYAYTAEIYPGKCRSTGIGLASSMNRVLGVFSPIIAMYADLTTSAPIFVSGALFILAAILTVFIPYESRNKLSL